VCLGVSTHRRGGNGAAHADHRGLAPEVSACCGEGEGENSPGSSYQTENWVTSVAFELRTELSI
jgi:hypothetical protein